MPFASEALFAYGRLLDHIPKNRKVPAMPDMITVEMFLRESGQLLTMLRDYHLEHQGEDSPFVRRLDTVIPRHKPSPPLPPPAGA